QGIRRYAPDLGAASLLQMGRLWREFSPLGSQSVALPRSEVLLRVRLNPRVRFSTSTAAPLPRMPSEGRSFVALKRWNRRVAAYHASSSSSAFASFRSGVSKPSVNQP